MLEAQPHDGALAWHQYAVGQEDSAIRIARARRSAGFAQPYVFRQPFGNHQQMRVYDSRAVVCDFINIHVASALAATVRVDARDGGLARHVEELETLVPPRQWIVVVDGQAAEHEAILGSQGGEIRTVLRVSEVAFVRLETVGG